MRTFDEDTKRKKRKEKVPRGMKTAQVSPYAVSLASVSVVYDWKFRKRNHKILPQSKANQHTIIVDRCMTAMTIMMDNGDDDDDANIVEEIAAPSSSSSMTIWVGGTSALAQTYVEEIILLSSSSPSSNNTTKNNYYDARNNNRYFILASPDPLIGMGGVTPTISTIPSVSTAKKLFPYQNVLI